MHFDCILTPSLNQNAINIKQVTNTILSKITKTKEISLKTYIQKGNKVNQTLYL